MIVSPRAEKLFTEALTLAPEVRVAFVKKKLEPTADSHDLTPMAHRPVTAAYASFAGYLAVHSERQVRAIALERDRAEAVKEILIGIFDAAGPNMSGTDLTAREILGAGRKRINTNLSDQPELRADLLTVMSEV